jgi:hypothetical protein
MAAAAFALRNGRIEHFIPTGTILSFNTRKVICFLHPAVELLRG